MKSKVDIIKSFYNKTLTDEERQDYINHYLSEEEKQIGKPFFEMNIDEDKQYNVLLYNNSWGDLKNYNCPICKNKGDIMFINKMGYEIYKECSCIKTRKNISNIQKSGLMGLLDKCCFEKYKTTDKWKSNIKLKAQNYALNPTNWFGIFGQSGLGKTHLCTAISSELLNKGYSLKYMMWIDESNYLKLNMKSEDYHKRIDELKNVDVLYIDDFFKTQDDVSPSPADIKLANEILNYRYIRTRINPQKYLTIVSSEKLFEELINIDEAIAGRLKEMCGDNFINIAKDINKNYRLKL